MGSHWGFSFFWKEFLAKHTVEGVVCILWSHGPVDLCHRQMDRKSFWQAVTLKSSLLCELFKGHFWWRSASPNSWPFFLEHCWHKPSPSLPFGQSTFCLAVKNPIRHWAGTGGPLGLMKHVPLVIVLTDCFAKAVISGRDRKLGCLMAPWHFSPCLIDGRYRTQPLSLLCWDSWCYWGWATVITRLRVCKELSR